MHKDIKETISSLKNIIKLHPIGIQFLLSDSYDHTVDYEKYEDLQYNLKIVEIASNILNHILEQNTNKTILNHKLVADKIGLTLHKILNQNYNRRLDNVFYNVNKKTPHYFIFMFLHKLLDKLVYKLNEDSAAFKINARINSFKKII